AARAPAAARRGGRRPANGDLQSDGGDGRGVRRRLLVEVAQLALDHRAELAAVVALELAELGDATFERVALALETSRFLTLLGLGLGADACDLGLGLLDQLLALGLTLCDVLVVQTLSELDDSGGSAGGRTLGCGSGLDRSCRRLGDGSRSDRRGSALTGLERSELRLELVVLLDGLAPFDDDLVEVVVHLFGVETVLESDVLELLVDDVIRGKCHGWLLFR